MADTIRIRRPYRVRAERPKGPTLSAEIRNEQKVVRQAKAKLTRDVYERIWNIYTGACQEGAKELNRSVRRVMLEMGQTAPRIERKKRGGNAWCAWLHSKGREVNAG